MLLFSFCCKKIMITRHSGAIIQTSWHHILQTPFFEATLEKQNQWRNNHCHSNWIEVMAHQHYLSKLLATSLLHFTSIRRPTSSSPRLRPGLLFQMGVCHALSHSLYYSSSWEPPIRGPACLLTHSLESSSSSSARKGRAEGHKWWPLLNNCDLSCVLGTPALLHFPRHIKATF